MRDRLSNISVAFFDSWIASSLLAIFLLITGILSYQTWLPKEGFPSVQFPLTVLDVQYFAGDSEQVDSQIAQPISDTLTDVEGVNEVYSTALDNNASVVVFFEDDVEPEAGTDRVKQSVAELQLPDEAETAFTTIDPSAFLNKYNVLVSVYADDADADLLSIQQKAEQIAAELEQNPKLKEATTIPLYREATNPETGESLLTQTGFNQIGLRQNEHDNLEFSNAVTVGVAKTDDIDIIELSEIIQNDLAQLEQDPNHEGYNFAIGADFASSIETQINSLESNLITGVLAVALVSFLLITWRASIITGAFMVSVMMATMLILFLAGYTLNTITLFALVLSLGLFVDDATIIVEAIDASKNKKTPIRQAVMEAIKQVAPASIAGTLTTVLVFLPMVFVSGILGEFIRLLPITVIIALLVSLVLSLTLIPFLARFLLVNTKKTMHLLGGIENRLADLAAAGPALFKTSKRKAWVVAVSSVALSLLMIASSFAIASNVPFNIFPDSDDSDQLRVEIDFAPGTNLEEAQELAGKVNEAVAQTLGGNVQQAAYGGFSTANERSAELVVDLTPFTDRGPTSQDLMSKLKPELDAATGDAASVDVVQLDAGPPAEDFPFQMQIYDEDRQKAANLAEQVQEYLKNMAVTLPSGEEAKITDTNVSNPQFVYRRDGQQYIQVTAAYDSDEVSALVEATKQKLQTEFDADRLREAGFSQDQVSYDFGQESDNAESFAALGTIFPIAILGILVLLAFQFRSVLQPLLIIMAIPFSLFGVFGGLYITDNAISFFSMIGFIGLIGIAVNNTILLTDYANQERRAGKDVVSAISEATRRRFRPLLTTTLTTVVALLPLALADPFWEPLAYAIIFGLASSTLLVLIAFPYYYLALTKFSVVTRRWFRNLRQGT